MKITQLLKSSLQFARAGLAPRVTYVIACSEGTRFEVTDPLRTVNDARAIGRYLERCAANGDLLKFVIEF